MQTTAFPMTERVVVQFEASLRVEALHLPSIVYPGHAVVNEKNCQNEDKQVLERLVTVIPGEKSLKALSRLTM